jgi:hypothetical protein
MSLGRTLGIWLLTAALMTMNGIVREVLLAKLVARTLADILSAALGVIIVLGVTRALIRTKPDVAASGLWRVSVLWLVLTVAFELVVGRYVDHKTWMELLDNYAIWHGRLWPIVLVSFVASPFLWLRPSGATAFRSARFHRIP